MGGLVCKRRGVVRIPIKSPRRDARTGCADTSTSHITTIIIIAFASRRPTGSPSTLMPASKHAYLLCAVRISPASPPTTPTLPPPGGVISDVSTRFGTPERTESSRRNAPSVSIALMSMKHTHARRRAGVDAGHYVMQNII